MSTFFMSIHLIFQVHFFSSSLFPLTPQKEGDVVFAPLRARSVEFDGVLTVARRA